jgi:hypothetical protein
MRHTTKLVILAVICWNVAEAFLIYKHLDGPHAQTVLWATAILATAVTATLAIRIDKQDLPIPVGVSYDLGFKQGYRTAEQKYLRLIRLIAQLLLLHRLKGDSHGKAQSPPER